MKTQKVLKPEEKVMIIYDYREREIAELLKKLGAAVSEQPLHVGDFATSKETVIERKTHSDFISSIIDGRLFEQAEKMSDNYDKAIMIIEGNSDRGINENALRGAIACMIVNFGITLLTTKNPFDTAKAIYWIAKREQDDGKPVAFKIGKKPADFKRLQEFIIASIPGVSVVLSKRLLERFGTVEEVFAASEKELTDVDRIGKKLAKRIRYVLTKKYE
jgi:Fanconi anemia group M protein